jgi:hypothetical protein
LLQTLRHVRAQLAALTRAGQRWLATEPRDVLAVVPRSSFVPAAADDGLEAGLVAWRRSIARWRAVAALRRWSVVALCVALALGLLGWLTALVPVAAQAAVAAVVLLVGCCLTLRRRSSTEAVARLLDARLGLAEQITSGLYVASRDRSSPHAGLTAHLTARSDTLVAHARRSSRACLAAARGEWSALAALALLTVLVAWLLPRHVAVGSGAGEATDHVGATAAPAVTRTASGGPTPRSRQPARRPSGRPQAPPPTRRPSPGDIGPSSRGSTPHARRRDTSPPPTSRGGGRTPSRPQPAGARRETSASGKTTAGKRPPTGGIGERPGTAASDHQVRLGRSRSLPRPSSSSPRGLRASVQQPPSRSGARPAEGGATAGRRPTGAPHQPGQAGSGTGAGRQPGSMGGAPRSGAPRPRAAGARIEIRPGGDGFGRVRGGKRGRSTSGQGVGGTARHTHDGRTGSPAAVYVPPDTNRVLPSDRGVVIRYFGGPAAG